MPSAPVPFAPVQQSGNEPLAGASPVALNVVFDGSGAVRRRPGIQASSIATNEVIDAAGITGLYVTEAGVIYAVGGPNPLSDVYRVTTGGALLLNSSGALYGGGRPTFAETELLLVLAAGSFIQKIELQTNLFDLLGGSPPQASHVAANASRILANDMIVDRTKVRYSSTAIGTTSYAGHEQWTPATGNTAGFFTAEARPDPVVAIFENTNEVFVFGTDTLQVYGPDSQLVYASGASLELGCSAPYSVVKHDQEMFWLDHESRFLQSDGRAFKVISDDMQATFDAVARAGNAESCFGYHIKQGSIDAIVWTFPDDGRTFVYQIDGGWSQWSGWDDARANWKPFAVSAHYGVHGTKVQLVGTTDGRIGELSRTARTDFGERINAYCETGFLNRQTEARKECKSLTLVLRRGVHDAEVSGRISWRDDLGAWGPEMPFSLGSSGEFSSEVIFRQLGTYRRRQWRFQFDGDADMVLAAATEDYRVLEG